MLRLLVLANTLGLVALSCEGAAPDAGASDAGPPAPVDAGGADGGASDAGARDGGVGDGGAGDGGPGDAGEPATGVTCTVTRRRPDCTAEVPEVYTDVPFTFYSPPAASGVGPVDGLTSPLQGLLDYYNSPFPPMFGAAGPELADYVVGDSTGWTGTLHRYQLRLEVDFDVGRQGSGCVEVPGAPPLIRVRCLGTTDLPPPACGWVDPALFTMAPPLECAVTRRDTATCTETTTFETPTVHASAGAHGADTVLTVDSPAIRELSAGSGPWVFHQDHPCESFGEGVTRMGTQVLLDRAGVRREYCRDALGRDQPMLGVSCGGVGTIAAAP